MSSLARIASCKGVTPFCRGEESAGGGGLRWPAGQIRDDENRTNLVWAGNICSAFFEKERGHWKLVVAHSTVERGDAALDRYKKNCGIVGRAGT